jgi:muramoyltetrapeptide carboxypeptidase
MIGTSDHIYKSDSDLLFKTKLIKPNALQKGDTVALIAPGSPIKPEKFQNAVTNLENLGLKPIYTDTVFKKYGYLAGKDEERLADLHLMIANPDVKAIWCLRGGYGCTRLLDKIDYKLIQKNPKIIIGYSDITALLLAIFKKTGIIGFHGPVAISDIFSSYTAAQVSDILFGRSNKLHNIPFKIQSQEKYGLGNEPYVVHGGLAKGQLTGGNLSLLVNLPNTKYAPSYKGKLVFIEDVGEKPYRIDRMLTFLLQSTDLRYASGIILGVFHECAPKEEDSLTLKQVILDRLHPLSIPCFYGFTFGHVGDICTFPIGINAEMNADNMSVTLQELAVNV